MMERVRTTMNEGRWHGLAFLLLFLMLGSCLAYGASTVQYLGPYYYQSSTSEGTVRVGHFNVNGQLAFCVQHEKGTVPSGTAVDERIYDDPAFRKALYYGYGGPEQWQGFTDEKQAVGIMSLLLTELNPGSRYGYGHYDSISGMKEYKAFLNSQPDVNTDLRFSPEKVRAFYSREMDMERTPDIKVTGGNRGTLTFTVPDDAVLHHNGTGQDLTGTVSLKPGESFYLKAPLGEKEDEDITVKGRNVRYQPIVFVPGNPALQNLTNLRPVTEEPETSRLKVTWIGLTDLVIEKRDHSTDRLLQGAEFTVRDISDYSWLKRLPEKEGGSHIRVGAIYTSKGDGRVVVKDAMVPGRSYKVTETAAPDGYMLNDRIHVIDSTGATPEEQVVFHNKAQYVVFRINKTGKVSKLAEGKLQLSDSGLKGGKFQIIAEEDITDVTSENGRIINKGQVAAEVVTGEDGTVQTPKLPEGKYRIKEIQAPQGYVLQKEEKVFDADVPEDQELVEQQADFYNYPQERVLRVYKYDMSTGRPLPGAEFQITSAGGETLDVVTDRTGYAIVRDLPDGKYTLREKKAPQGYVKDDEVREFVISRDGALRDLVIVRIGNKSAGPETGDDGKTLFLYMVLGTATGLALIAAVAGKRYNGSKES